MKTDTSKTNLVDFAQNLAVTQLDNSLNFLAKNYKTLKEVVKNDNFEPFDDFMGLSLEVLVRIGSGFLITITIIVFVILLCLSVKIDENIKEI